MLSPDERLSLLDTVGVVAAATDVTDFGIRACRELLRHVPGISTSYNEVNVLAQRAAGLIYPDPGREWMAHYLPIFERHLADSPMAEHFMTGEGAMVTWADLDPDGRFRQTALYREFYVPNGIHSQAAFLLPAPPGIVVAFAMNRDGADFEPRERALVEELRPYLTNLYRLVTQAEAGRAREAALADDGWSVVLVDDTGLVVDTNPVAQRMGKAAGFDLSVGSRLGDQALWSQFAEHSNDLWATARMGSPAPMPAPVPFEARLVRFGVGPHLVWLREPSSVTLEHARSFGLTRRQAEIALHLVDGLTNDQIARKLGIAAGTVRKHLEVVFDKLGVPSRAAAVGRLKSRAA